MLTILSLSHIHTANVHNHFTTEPSLLRYLGLSLHYLNAIVCTCDLEVHVLSQRRAVNDVDLDFGGRAVNNFREHGSNDTANRESAGKRQYELRNDKRYLAINNKSHGLRNEALGRTSHTKSQCVVPITDAREIGGHLLETERRNVE